MIRKRWRGGAALIVSAMIHGLAFLVGYIALGGDQESTCVQDVSTGDLSLTLTIPSFDVAAGHAAGGQEEQSVEQNFRIEMHDEATDAAPASALVAPTIVGNRGYGSIGRGSAGTGLASSAHILPDAPPNARTIVYVIDRSLSMGLHGSLKRARTAVLASLQCLPHRTTVQVMVYNREAQILQPTGKIGYLSVDDATVHAIGEALGSIAPSGTTDHVHALLKALQLRPDLLYLVTDADDLSDAEVARITQLNGGRTVIDTIELSSHRTISDGPLKRLAVLNGGAYRLPANAE
jgi:hypothetical protein